MDSQRKRIEAFLQLATEELGVATGLVEKAPRQCAYLLQQAAEKMARAILTAAGVQPAPGGSRRMSGSSPTCWKKLVGFSAESAKNAEAGKKSKAR